MDVWINNAGADILTGEAGRLSRLQKLDLVLAVDLRGTVLASWAAVDLMREQGGGGTIINMAWDHVTQGMEGENPAVYSAAKGGVASFSRSLARDVAPAIRVNILAPGFIETAFGEEADPKFRQKSDRDDAAPALGEARGRSRRRALSGLGRRGVSHRADDYGEWGSGDVMRGYELLAVAVSRLAPRITQSFNGKTS